MSSGDAFLAKLSLAKRAFFSYLNTCSASEPLGPPLAMNVGDA
jgi:hypothetical protein